MSDRVAIIGAGFIGRAWAIAFARAGREVRLRDPRRDANEACLATVDGLLADLSARQRWRDRNLMALAAHKRRVLRGFGT